MNILRWIVLAPATLIAPFLILFPVHWFLMITGWGDDQWFGLVSVTGAEYVLSAYAAPAAMIHTAHYIAPDLKYEASVFAAGVWAIIFLLMAGYALLHVSLDGWQWARFAFMCVATVIGIMAPFKDGFGST